MHQISQKLKSEIIFSILNLLRMTDITFKIAYKYIDTSKYTNLM